MGSSRKRGQRRIRIWQWRAGVGRSWNDEQEAYGIQHRCIPPGGGHLRGSAGAGNQEVVAWQLAEAMKKKKISKSKMAMLLKTSRTQVDRLLDPKKRHHARQPATGRRNSRAPREHRVDVAGQAGWRRVIGALPRPSARLAVGNSAADRIDCVAQAVQPDRQGLLLSNGVRLWRNSVNMLQFPWYMYRPLWPGGRPPKK